MNNELSRTYFLSANEVNAQGELSLPTLATNIIEIATEHANSLGIGNPAMVSLGAGWVLSRLSIELKSCPKVNSEYKLTTWVESWNRSFSMRCFAFESVDGKETYGYARSVWMVMGTESHENVGLSHLNLPEGAISDRVCPIPRQIKHRSLDPQADLSAQYRFRYCDIDYYRHVNTVRYISLLLNQFPMSLYDEKMIDRFEICFHHEGHYDEDILILRAEEPELGTTALNLIDKADPTRSINSARIRFKSRAEE